MGRVFPFPTGDGSGEHLLNFCAQNGKFWCIVGANFIAVELPVLYMHKPVTSYRLWLVKPIASLCVKKVGGVLHDSSPGLKSGGHVPCPLVYMPLLGYEVSTSCTWYRLAA